MRPGIEPASSWMLVRVISAELGCELLEINLIPNPIYGKTLKISSKKKETKKTKNPEACLRVYSVNIVQLRKF